MKKKIHLNNLNIKKWKKKKKLRSEKKKVPKPRKKRVFARVRFDFRYYWRKEIAVHCLVFFCHFFSFAMKKVFGLWFWNDSCFLNYVKAPIGSGPFCEIWISDLNHGYFWRGMIYLISITAVISFFLFFFFFFYQIVGYVIINRSSFLFKALIQFLIKKNYLIHFRWKINNI